MGRIQPEFQRFLNHLSGLDVPDDVRRMAHIVFDHLSTLSAVGAGRRARSVRLAPLALDHLAGTPAERAEVAQGAQNAIDVRRLHRLDVGPFRGFMRQETFDLSREITLVYGANGTGKSSFCEALEYAMLGTISEAQAKRIDQRLYCDNARLRRHEAPALFALGDGGAPEPLRPDEAAFRFCFIEKNRLDDFARIAARTPGDQRQLIATLFGIDEFSDFVRGFNPSLDENLMLTGVQAYELTQRRTRLASSEQVIAGHAEKLAQISASEEALAQRITPGVSYKGCFDWLHGTPQQLGRLPFVIAQLDAPLPSIHNVQPSRLSHFLAEVHRLQGLLNELSETLAARASEVSYSQLYDALIALADGASECPACGTDLSVVAHNPFERARAGLAQLAHLGELQARHRRHAVELSDAARVLCDEMRRVCGIAATVCGDAYREASLPPVPQLPTEGWLDPWVTGEQQSWNSILRLAADLEHADAQAQATHAQRAELIRERDILLQHQLQMDRLTTLRQVADGELQDARRVVVEFEEMNRDLIISAQAEVDVVAHHHRVKRAYDAFLPELQRYLGELPGKLLQGLGEQARTLYNAFNREDAPGDRLQTLSLPVAEHGKIEVVFEGDTTRAYDALVVLSEGHIRCLGLAILLAKNIADGCPAVIFDDVVNAIDDEHRDSIWRTFFEDGHLHGKQVILTSHAQEFLHRIEQELGADRAAAIRRYKFLPHLGEHELRVDSDPPVKNYVLLSQQALANDEYREALRQARPALESLTDRLWRWLGNRGDGRLELKLAGPRSPYELNNKCTKLRAALNALVEQYPGTPAVVAALTSLIGVRGTSIEWGCLNAGVHDSQRDHEFDRAAVRTIVEAVTALDISLGTLQSRRATG